MFSRIIYTGVNGRFKVTEQPLSINAFGEYSESVNSINCVSNSIMDLIDNDGKMQKDLTMSAGEADKSTGRKFKMEFQENVILVILGAVISIVPTTILNLIDIWMNKRGEIRIYKKIVYSNLNERTWGFSNGSNGMILMGLMWLEINNTKGIPILIRDNL